MLRPISVYVGLCALLLGAETAGRQASYPLSNAPERLRPAISQADAVFSQLQERLVSTLTAELQRGGATRAVTVCHTEAQTIARRVAAESGILLGRTSHRLRNPDNAAPEWARAFVDAKPGRASDAEAVVVDLGERVGVLRPIATGPLCTTCHGPLRELAPDLRETLQALYPRDQAVDFRAGDLRGWMWAEVPLTASVPRGTAR